MLLKKGLCGQLFATDWVQLLWGDFLVLGLCSQLWAHEFNAHNLPHKLQRAFELHESRRRIDDDPTSIVKLGRELSNSFTEPLSNRSDLRFKDVLYSRDRSFANVDGVVIYDAQVHIDDFGRWRECKHVHHFIGAFL